MKQILTFSLLASLALACNPCRNEQVPAIHLYLEEGVYQEAVIISNEYTTQKLLPGASVKLPYSLNSDTTIFYFYTLRGSVADTLSVTYTRRAILEDGRCGFYLAIEDPLVLPQSTFDSIEVYQDEPHTDLKLSIYE